MAAAGLPSIPGYILTRRIASGSSGEVYEAVAPGGISKAIKFVPIDFSSALSRREIEGVGLIRSIRHPHLIAIDRVDVRDDSIVIVMELADGSLRDEFRAARTSGLEGIPRRRLLGWLSEIAEVLDFLNLRHSVRHLDVKPENCFLISGHLKIGDFGLVRDGARGPVNRRSQAGTPAYAAPELFDGSTARTSDQYSLAVVCCEMLTGRRPFSGRHAAELVLNQATSIPNLSRISEPDLPHLLQALDRNPDRRFGSCTEFINALLDNDVEGEKGEIHYSGPAAGHLRASTSWKSIAGLEDSWDQPALSATTILDSDLAVLTRNGRPSSRFVSHWTLPCDLLKACVPFEQMAAARRLPILKPSPFRIVVELKGGPRSWRPLLGVRDPFLLVVDVLPRADLTSGVHVVATLEHHGAKLPPKVFDQHARALMDEILSEVRLDRAEPTPIREDSRVAIEHRVEVAFIQGPMRSMRIPCTAVNVSRRGIGLLSAAPLPLENAVLHAPYLDRPIPARIVWNRRSPEKPLYEIGLLALDGADPLELFAAIGDR
jgi:serine/threonine protein kinase